MPPCEWCWERAGVLAEARGLSRAEVYSELVLAQDELGPRAECPIARRAWAHLTEAPRPA